MCSCEVGPSGSKKLLLVLQGSSGWDLGDRGGGGARRRPPVQLCKFAGLLGVRGGGRVAGVGGLVGDQAGLHDLGGLAGVLGVLVGGVAGVGGVALLGV